MPESLFSAYLALLFLLIHKALKRLASFLLPFFLLLRALPFFRHSTLGLFFDSDIFGDAPGYLAYEIPNSLK